ncbi:MAG TPA: 16S rRNA (cytidine(1402)-2'-O)-methyltransferase [Steroidobacteraceae bacterium]|nr:16S rRNA (cytidine(1402)-2'-O)-methyltransferase [Steroidobacteraceae bacterium]
MTNDRTGLPAAGRLYVVATPIGNLGDLSARARETLANCALIAAEDTRHTGILLKHFGIATPQLSLHEHNEATRAIEIIARLREGKSVALVSDAGTPAISDPGFELVRAVAAAGIDIIAIPGPCAAIAALSIGALPTDRFCFEGFLPARGAARRQRLKSLEQESRTLVIYESPHRVRETLEDCVAAFGEARAAAVVREATKLHETTYRGSLLELLNKSQSDADFARGEIVLLIGGAPQTAAGDADSEGKAELDKVLTALLAELPLKQAARLAAQITGARDNEAYKRALFLKQQSASH